MRSFIRMRRACLQAMQAGAPLRRVGAICPIWHHFRGLKEFLLRISRKSIDFLRMARIFKLSKHFRDARIHMMKTTSLTRRHLLPVCPNKKRRPTLRRLLASVRPRGRRTGCRSSPPPA